MKPVQFTGAQADLVAELLRDYIAAQDRIARHDESVNARIEASKARSTAQGALYAVAVA